MTDDLMEQKRRKITERFEREQAIYEKSFEDNARLLKNSIDENNQAGIDLAKKNMGEANEILGELLKQKKEALNNLQTVENVPQADNEENQIHASTRDIFMQLDETKEKSEEKDYDYGYGM